MGNALYDFLRTTDSNSKKKHFTFLPGILMLFSFFSSALQCGLALKNVKLAFSQNKINVLPSEVAKKISLCNKINPKSEHTIPFFVLFFCVTNIALFKKLVFSVFGANHDAERYLSATSLGKASFKSVIPFKNDKEVY